MTKEMMPIEAIEQKIFIIRGQKVMIDKDLAELYQVPTRALKQAVKRNMARFPKEFMFKLRKSEKDELVTICDRLNTLKHSSTLPYAFIEHGVAMLASVLTSERAIKINISIIKAFERLRMMISAHKELAHKLKELEQRIAKHDEEIQTLFEAIQGLMEPPPQNPKKEIGFHVKYRACRLAAPSSSMLVRPVRPPDLQGGQPTKTSAPPEG